jgi:hypothetical protein
MAQSCCLLKLLNFTGFVVQKALVLTLIDAGGFTTTTLEPHQGTDAGGSLVAPRSVNGQNLREVSINYIDPYSDYDL